MSKLVKLVNTSDESLHFPHIGTFLPKGSLEVSEENAEILLRNKSLKLATPEGKKSVKGVSHDRSMKGIERE